jgi:hypothetical protein
MAKPKSHNLYKPNAGLSTDKADFNQIQWGIQRDSGFVIGKSSFPVFFTADGHNAHIEDSARGSSIVICTKTTERIPSNVHTMGIDECQCDPNIIMIDNLSSINKSHLLSPSILKLAPASMAAQRINGTMLAHFPFVFYYRKHKSFNAASFFLEETIWSDGNQDLSIFSAIKLAFVLGYREIYLGDIKQSTKAYSNFKLLMRYVGGSGLKLFKIGSGPEEIPSMSASEAFKKCIL